MNNLPRYFALPSADTFMCKPIGDMVLRYLAESQVSIDPFARNCTWATHTNDLNPDTLAEYHLDVLDFLKLMLGLGILTDLIIWDPPYSPRQIKELYDSIGLRMTQQDGWRTHSWTAEKQLCHQLLAKGGVFLHFGWDTSGICHDGYEIIDLFTVYHGAGHNDTLCMAQRKVINQVSL